MMATDTPFRALRGLFQGFAVDGNRCVDNNLRILVKFDGLAYARSLQRVRRKKTQVRK